MNVSIYKHRFLRIIYIYIGRGKDDDDDRVSFSMCDDIERVARHIDLDYRSLLHRFAVIKRVCQYTYIYIYSAYNELNEKIVHAIRTCLITISEDSSVSVK